MEGRSTVCKVRTGLAITAMAACLALGSGDAFSPSASARTAWKETAYCNEQLRWYNMEMTYAHQAWLAGDYDLMQMHSDNADFFIDRWYDAGCDRP